MTARNGVYHFLFLSRQVKHAATARRRGYPVFGKMRLPSSLIGPVRVGGEISDEDDLLTRESGSRSA